MELLISASQPFLQSFTYIYCTGTIARSNWQIEKHRGVRYKETQTLPIVFQSSVGETETNNEAQHHNKEKGGLKCSQE
jgi:hypothetical protein